MEIYLNAISLEANLLKCLETFLWSNKHTIFIMRGLISKCCMHTKQDLKVAHITFHAKIVIYKKNRTMWCTYTQILNLAHVHFGDGGNWWCRWWDRELKPCFISFHIRPVDPHNHKHPSLQYYRCVPVVSHYYSINTQHSMFIYLTSNFRFRLERWMAPTDALIVATRVAISLIAE